VLLQATAKTRCLTFAKIFAIVFANMNTKGKSKRAKREQFRLSHFTNPSGQIVWRVSGTKKDGTRVRENFKTELEATTRKQELETEDLNFKPVPFRQTRLTPEQILDAERAIDELRGRASLMSAARFYNDNYQDPLKPARLTDAVETFKAEKQAEKVRPDTFNNLRFRLGAFLENMPAEKPVHEIMPEQIHAFLHRINGKPRAKRTIKNDRLVLSNFFNWAMSRKLCVKNPMESVAKVRAGSKMPGVFSLAQVRKLLDAASMHEDGKCLPYFALGLFCGLRPNETERLTWDKIDLADKIVTIDAATAKVTTDGHCNERYVSISDNAVKWLKPFELSKPALSIDRKDFEAIKALAGIEKWPMDVLRHTAISNYQAHNQHEGLTAEWAGNSVAVVKKRYRRAIKPADAASFWAIAPDGTGQQNTVATSKSGQPDAKSAVP
jgi:site-specific recombinase XerD